MIGSGHSEASELWVYLDDKSVLPDDSPSCMAAEGYRLASAAGLRTCGIARTALAAQRLIAAGQCSGVEVIYALSDGPESPEASLIQHASQLSKAVEGHRPRVVMFPDTMPGAEIGARVAAQLGCAFFSHCVDLEWQERQIVVRRSVFNGLAHQVLQPVGSPPWIATVDPKILDKKGLGTSIVPAVQVLGNSGASENTGHSSSETWRVPARELDLLDADIVLSVGRGVKDDETLRQVHELADLLGAAVGGSREAVFAGLVTRDRQVGASGKWIAPRIYVALGISGSTYHMMGLREAKHLVAVNIDPRAPIFERAEIGVAEDVAMILPALLTAMKEN